MTTLNLEGREETHRKLGQESRSDTALHSQPSRCIINFLRKVSCGASSRPSQHVKTELKFRICSHLPYTVLSVSETIWEGTGEGTSAA
jgi:hypothetical protein